MVIDRIKTIQQRTGVKNIDIVSDGSGSGSSWRGGRFTVKGSDQAVKQAGAIIREIMKEGYRALDLQEKSYDKSREKQFRKRGPLQRRKADVQKGWDWT
eukprot:16441785-Heterocapsa_arctica.AAC.1